MFYHLGNFNKFLKLYYIAVDTAKDQLWRSCLFDILTTDCGGGHGSCHHLCFVVKSFTFMSFAVTQIFMYTGWINSFFIIRENKNRRLENTYLSLITLSALSWQYNTVTFLECFLHSCKYTLLEIVPQDFNSGIAEICFSLSLNAYMINQNMLVFRIICSLFLCFVLIFIWCTYSQ